MSTRIERVQTNAGWYGRVVGDSGVSLWATALLVEERSVLEAVLSFARMLGLGRALVMANSSTTLLVFETPDSDGVLRTTEAQLIDVDERTKP